MSGVGENGRSKKSYVLVTAAYNEGAFIERPLSSVVSQTVPPLKWIIVSDGSTDRTDDIVQAYAEKYGFIQLHRMKEEHPRNFAAQVNAINAGFALVENFDYDFIGNLDADISLEPTYFARLLEKFEQDPGLGLGGGYIYEAGNGEFRCRRMNTMLSVPHAIQLFRRECLEAIGGYTPLPYGGPDWHAAVSLRKRGWRTQSFPELKVFHHRPTGSVEGSLHSWYRMGLMDYSMGTHPLFEVFRLGRRLREKPFVIGVLARLTGFVWAYCRGEKRQVSYDFIRFLRQEQMERLWSWLRRNPRGSLRSPVSSCTHQETYGAERILR